MSFALAAPALVQAGGSFIGGLLGSNASNKAAQQQAQANQTVIGNTNQAVSQGKSDIATGTTNANDILSRSAQTQLGLYQPYVAAGQDALTGIQQLSAAGGPLDEKFSFNPSDLEKDPGFAFALKQGKDAIARSAAVRGNLFSSSTIKDLTAFGEGTANTYFNDAYKRAADTFNINRQGALARINTMQGLAGMGLSGTNAGAQAVGSTSALQANNVENQGSQFANLGLHGNDTIANALTRQADAKAAGTIGSTNSILSGIGGVGNAISNASLNKFLLDRGVFGKSSSSGGGQQSAGPGWSGALPSSWSSGINDDA